MSIDNAIQEAIQSIPECVAGGYVDLDSGMLLSVKTVDSHPSEVLDLLAAATSDLFEGSTVVTIEDIFKKARGIENENLHYFKEVIVNSDNLVHVFLRGKKHDRQVACFVCRNSVNLGMALTKARAGLTMVEEAV